MEKSMGLNLIMVVNMVAGKAKVQMENISLALLGLEELRKTTNSLP